MAEVKWIKITTDIFDDEKILLIESLPDAYAIITVWFKLLCLAGKQNNSGVFMMGKIAYTDKMLATIFRMKEATVTMALNTFEQFGMVEIVDGVITIPNWDKHQTLDAYENKKERDRLYQQERRHKQRMLVNKSSDSHATQSSDVAVSEEDKERDKEIRNKKSVRETTRTLFERLLPDYVMSFPGHEALVDKLTEWFKYKTERKEPYKEQGMKSLLRQIEKNCLTYGDQAICDLIDESMANSWKGIIFDRLKNNVKPQGRKEIVPDWMNKNRFNNFEQRSYDFADMEKQLLGLNTTANNPELAARADALIERIKG